MPILDPQLAFSPLPEFRFDTISIELKTPKGPVGVGDTFTRRGGPTGTLASLPQPITSSLHRTRGVILQLHFRLSGNAEAE